MHEQNQKLHWKYCTSVTSAEEDFVWVLNSVIPK